MFIFVSIYSLGGKSRSLTERMMFCDEDGNHYIFERQGVDAFWEFIDCTGERSSFKTRDIEVAKVLAEISIVQRKKDEVQKQE